MIERIDLFHIPFYKKEAFTGSDRGVRFWIGRREAEGEEFFHVILWPEPFALKHTADEKKLERDFPFTEEGLDRVYEWILGEGRGRINV